MSRHPGQGAVRVERNGDLMYWTYHMMDWTKLDQRPSEQRCVQCGGTLQMIGPAEDSKGRRYDGLACHVCKRLIWARES